MFSRLSRRVALALSAVLLVSAVAAAPASAAAPTSVTCSYSGGTLTANFTVSPDGYYAWAWRIGRKALGGGVGMITTSATKSATTRTGLNGADIWFGVVSLANPMDYTYINCDD